LSFFDEDDEPRRAPRPRRAVPAGPTSTDPQTIRIRQGIALVVGIVLLLVIVFGIKGCVNTRKKNALKDYNGEVRSLIAESDGTVGKQLFEQLGSGRASPLDLQSAVNQLRVTADEQVKRARSLDVPGDMKGAQRNLLLVLGLRRDAIGKIAQKLPTAQGRTGAAAAVESIAGEMRAFDASDVVFAWRVEPLIKEALDRNGVGGQRIPTSAFLPSIDWLDPTKVAAALGTSISGGSKRGPAAPGLHGFGLQSVTAGGVTVQPGGTLNRIPAAADLAFSVSLQNQGENDEADVVVKLTVTGGARPISVQKTIDRVNRGQTATVTIPLGRAPPIGTPVSLRVQVVPVPGETKTDNNRQSYAVLFTR
jgi:hypothetical protein